MQYSTKIHHPVYVYVESGELCHLVRNLMMGILLRRQGGGKALWSGRAAGCQLYWCCQVHNPVDIDRRAQEGAAFASKALHLK